MQGYKGRKDLMCRHTYYTCTIQIKLSTCDSENFTRTNVHVERIDQEQKVCTKFFLYGE